MTLPMKIGGEKGDMILVVKVKVKVKEKEGDGDGMTSLMKTKNMLEIESKKREKSDMIRTATTVKVLRNGKIDTIKVANVALAT